MRIGILTVPFNNNYGGYLQSYALMTTLKKMGHQPTLIMRRHNSKKVTFRYKIMYFIKNSIKSILYLSPYNVFYNEENIFRHRGKDIQRFLHKYIQPQTKYIYTTEELVAECKERFDAYIVGSDQVWRSIYVPTILGNMFLDFTKDWKVKRIAYAASFGTDCPEYTPEEKRLCGNLIKVFDAVSVREDSGLKVFDDFNWNVPNPKIVMDPTLLLSKEDYNALLPIQNLDAKGKVFCYVLDKSDDAQIAIKGIIKQLNKPLYEITDIQKGDSILPSVESWLSAIRDSEFVITDSFHGTVFSIIFNKPFLVYVNQTRGADRFVSLLHKFGLVDNIISDNTNIKNCFHVDWNSVNDSISRQAKDSISFIINTLKN